MADDTERRPATPPSEAPTATGQEVPSVERLADFDEQPHLLEELGVEARSQWRMVLGRFLGHRLAMVSLCLLVFMFLLSLAGGRFWTYGYTDRVPGAFSQPPSLSHPFGTNEIGRDGFAMVLRGAQKSLQVAMIVAVVSTLIGTIMGALAGYYRGLLDAVLMRVTDLFLIFPALVLLIVLAREFSTQGILTLALLISAFGWMSLARIVRGEFLSLREREFVEAARALGASDRRIIFRHLLPNATGPIIVNATLLVAVAVLIEAALSFLGFGVQPPDTSLGKLVADGVPAARTRWWLFYLPGLYLVVIVLCVNFVGDGLRDAFDPQQQKVRE